MKVAGVRLLLVPDKEDNIVGIITAADILSDLPVKKGQELEIAHDDLDVDTIMTPLNKVLAVDMGTVRDSRVGHIISTLRNHERQHMLVAETHGKTRQHVIRGLFSTTQISKLVGQDITDPEYAVHTLAEVYRKLG
jgi:CBS domain-containing protein